eukprot:9473679-Pyramimonas_sp.AAC.1
MPATDLTRRFEARLLRSGRRLRHVACRQPHAAAGRTQQRNGNPQQFVPTAIEWKDLFTDWTLQNDSSPIQSECLDLVDSIVQHIVPLFTQVGDEEYMAAKVDKRNLLTKYILYMEPHIKAMTDVTTKKNMNHNERAFVCTAQHIEEFKPLSGQAGQF